MIKLYNDLKPHNPKLLYFNDVCHLIHVAVDFALQCEGFSILRKVIIKFGAVFKHANKLEQHFKDILRSIGLPETELSKPSAVVKIRWYSFFDSAQGTLKLWRYLIFIDRPDSEGEKVTKLKEILGNNENRQSLYVKLIFVIEQLKPIHSIQKILESNESLLHQMSHIVSMNLQMEMTSIQILLLCLMKVLDIRVGADYKFMIMIMIMIMAIKKNPDYDYDYDYGYQKNPDYDYDYVFHYDYYLARCYSTSFIT